MMQPCPPHDAPSPSLRPELTRLVDVGMLERAMVGDGARGPGAFDELALALARRGTLTAGQAAAMAALLGLSRCAPANDLEAG